MNEGMKFDVGKNRLDLIPPKIIEALGLVYTYGAAKYADRNWEKGIPYHKVYGSALRHLLSFWNGEDTDPESGLPHLCHCAWNIVALLHYSLFPSVYREYDDRVVYEGGDTWDKIVERMEAGVQLARDKFEAQRAAAKGGGEAQGAAAKGGGEAQGGFVTIERLKQLREAADKQDNVKFKPWKGPVIIGISDRDGHQSEF